MRQPTRIPVDIDMRINDRLRELARSKGIDVPRRATSKEIARVADYFRGELPGELAAWIGMSLGPIFLDRPTLGFGNRESDSICANFDNVLAMYPAWRELRWCPIASDGCGNYYLMSVEGGRVSTIRPVFFVDTEEDWSSAAYAVASHLFHFLIFLLDYEFVVDNRFLVENQLKAAAWPFKKKYVLERDPNLELVDNLPLPWD